MVSCQWELTSGAREGQACGRGKNVFCKTHEPKATRQAERSSESSHLLGDYLADKFTRQLKGVITSNTYGGADYSTSWIGGPKDMVSNQSGLNRDMTRGGPLQQLESITRPAIVSMWLEQELAKVTIRNNQMFPPPITKKQWMALSNLSNIFSQRLKMADAWAPYIRNEGQDSKVIIPEPFFQRRYKGRSFGHPAHFFGRPTNEEQQLYNQGFILFLQSCIAPSPDYQALWTWFYPKFQAMVRNWLNLQSQNYDVTAIEKDLRELLSAYSTDLEEGRYVGPNTNRYRQYIN